MTTYVNKKDSRGLETVDECETYAEAESLCQMYRLADPSAVYYLSYRRIPGKELEAKTTWSKRELTRE